jgi:hypothetical protein
MLSLQNLRLVILSSDIEEMCNPITVKYFIIYHLDIEKKTFFRLDIKDKNSEKK